MKRIALAFLALSTFAGCAASSSDDAGEASDAVTAAPITSLDLETDVSNFICDDRPNGMVMSFDFQDRTFVTKQNSSNIWGCEAELGTLVKAGAHSVEVVTHAGEGILTTALVLDGGAWTFTSYVPLS